MKQSALNRIDSYILDLYRLGNPSIYSIIDQIYFEFHANIEMKDEVQMIVSAQKIFLSEIKLNTGTPCQEKGKGRLNSFLSICKLFKQMPLLSKFIHQTFPSSIIEICFEKGVVEISWSYRNLPCKKDFKQLLENSLTEEMLLTSRLCEEEKKIKLHFNFDCNWIYKKHRVFRLEELVKKYTIVVNLDKHEVFVVTGKNKYFQNESDLIFEFPFLFCNLYLIIKGGEFINSSRNYKATGSGLPDDKHDVSLPGFQSFNSYSFLQLIREAL